jgi:hypothetical protein
MRYVFRALLALVGVFVAGCFVPVTHEGSTCVLCRAYRRQTTYAFMPVTSHEENQCSRWYAAHVEPRHAHVWERGTCVYESDLWGSPRSVACSSGHFPIWLLPPETQMAAYQHFQDPLEAKALFAGLTDARIHDDRLDEHDDDKGHLIVKAIEEWAAAGFPGTWQAWWDAWWAKHVAEHKEWLEWLHADSDLNFWDWQKKRKDTVSPR